MECVGELINKNKGVFKRMVRGGLISCSVVNHYEMYKFYKGVDNSLSKMEKYQLTAEEFRVDIKTIIRAIKKMER
ncbi:hypothetical protein ETU08_07605 [Apibacter muscae]|uniref:hypothetical protein n=1 Tax=Apibacter muscae TaxID=2509004 RepID=UPI0011ADDF61|nr:hypothetical protein [Apibacter muscae]TWP29357.1 hypothetical protein ETU08_07605 [Apibacter muscae]